MRKRVSPGAYGVGVAHAGAGATAYCVSEYGGDVSNESDGDDGSKVWAGGLTVRLAASKTVTMGMMHAEPPKFESEHDACAS